MNNKNLFDISVIIPVFNAAPYISKAVNSALQLEEVKEIILVEDYSRDNSHEVCCEIAKSYERVKSYRTPGGHNQGASVARNTGLKNASMDHVAFLDADDYYLPNRFLKDRVIFDSVPEADGVYNCLGKHFYSDAGKDLFERSFGADHDLTTVKEEISCDELFPVLLGMNGNKGHFSVDTLTIKRSSLKKMSYWFNDNLELHEDTEFILRLAWHCKLYPGEIKKPVAARGIHDNNRITRTLTNKNLREKHQAKLWESVYVWADNINLAPAYLEHIEITYLEKKFMQYSKPLRILKFMTYYLAAFFTDNKSYRDLHTTVLGHGRVSLFLLKLALRVNKVISARNSRSSEIK